jgi:hypothetical protein
MQHHQAARTSRTAPTSSPTEKPRLYYKAAALARVSTWIEDYNQHRRHSALAMMVPTGYERALQAGKAG